MVALAAQPSRATSWAPHNHYARYGVVLLLWFAVPVRADWIAFTGAEKATTLAEISIQGKRLRVQLEIGDADLSTFEDLLGQDSQEPPERALRHFSRHVFAVLTGDGRRLQPRLLRAQRQPQKDRRASNASNQAPAKAQALVLFAELEYELSGEPQELTFVPPMDGTGGLKAEIGFIVFHNTVPIIDYQYLRQAEKLLLDWQDPWYTHFENPKLTRHHKAPLMSFLYVEPYEVRQEILLRVKDIRASLDIKLRDEAEIAADELGAVKQAVLHFLKTRNRVWVDDKEPRRILDSAEYVQISLEGVQPLPSLRPQSLSTAMLGVVFAYITPRLPRSVKVNWDLFPPQIAHVPISAFDPIGQFVSYVTPQSPLFEWPSFPEDLELLKEQSAVGVQALKVSDAGGQRRTPLGSLVLLLLLLVLLCQIQICRREGRPTGLFISLACVLGIATPLAYPYFGVSLGRSDGLAPSFGLDEKSAILGGLLKNVYRAFDFREEDDVYDKLAFSVSGPLLEKIYLQNRRAFIAAKTGGTRVRIKEVELLAVIDVPRPDSVPAFTLRSRWTALGTVGHWGHVHPRENFYEALVTIEPVTGVWKITGLEVLNEHRLDARS
ncbi:MAG: hypothetical protein ACREYE_18775 [Gammaproteobacteria bacterium]